MKTVTLFAISFIICWLSGVEANAQNIGINGTGVNAHPSALLDIDDAGTNTKGLLIPRLALTAINVSTPVTAPATSLLVYNTATASTGSNAVSPGYYYWDGVKWVRFQYTFNGATSLDWSTTGNVITNSSVNFLGTTSNQSLRIRTNNLENMVVDSLGRIGVGIKYPQTPIHVISKQPSTTLHPYRVGILAASEGTDLGGRVGMLVASNIENPKIFFHRSQGTLASPIGINVNDVLGSIHFEGYDGSIFAGNGQGGAYISANASENWSAAVGGANIAFHTTLNGTKAEVERMRIEHNGNVGIGTTAPTALLNVEKGNILEKNENTFAVISAEAYSSLSFVHSGRFIGRRGRGTISSPLPAITDDLLSGFEGRSTLGGIGGGMNIFAAENQSATNAGTYLTFVNTSIGGTAQVENMRMLGNGNVGINNTTPTQKLDLVGRALFRSNSAVPTGNIWSGTSNVDGIEFGGAGTDYYFGAQRTSGVAAVMHISQGLAAPASGALVGFYRAGVNIGSITFPTSASVAYNTTSDERLKENIKDTRFGINDILKINVKDYNYKANDTKQVLNGFIAQQLYSIYPEAVTKGGEDPKIQPWMIDYGKLTPLLVKGMQDQQAQIEQLLKRIEQLEKK